MVAEINALTKAIDFSTTISRPRTKPTSKGGRSRKGKGNNNNNEKGGGDEKQPKKEKDNNNNKK